MTLETIRQGVADTGRPLLILTSGLPRSGKSTWARQQHGAVVVDVDMVRLALYARPFIVEMEEIVWTFARTMVKTHALTGVTAIILVSCMGRRRYRQPWLMGDLWTPVVVEFPVSVSVCCDRARRDERLDLLPVITRMAEDWEFVVEDEDVCRFTHET